MSSFLGTIKKQTGQYRLEFDTSGGTITVKHSRQTINKYPAGTAPDHKNLIGVHGEEVEGAEIVIPALRLDVIFSHPLGVISLNRIKALARNTACVNNDVFMTFSPGELLFLGASGSDGSDTEAEVKYSFAASENATGLTIGTITSIEKVGWDVLWISYKDAVDATKPVKQPEFVYVERVYKELNFTNFFGW